MKNFLLHVFKDPMIVVFVVVSIVFGIPALAASSQINKNAVVVGVGIDLSEEGEKKYDVSFLTFAPVPEQNFTETYKIVAAEGDSIAEASNFAGLNLGRTLRFSHMKTIVLSEDVVMEDIPKLLDYLARGNELSGSTKIIATKSKAKEFLSVAQKLDSESSVKISELVSNNAKEASAADATIETFFKGYLGPTKMSIIPLFDLEQDEDEGMSVATMVSDSEESKSGEKKKDKKFIVNSGDAIVFKDGKMLSTIDSEQVQNINWIKGDFARGFVEIKDFNSKTFDGADLTFEIFGSGRRRKIVFENGTPVVYLNPRVNIVLAEVEKDGMLTRNVEFFVLADEDIEILNQHIRQFFADGINWMRENKADLVDFYTLLWNANKGEFQKFLRNLEDESDYLSHIVFKVGVKARTR